MVSNYVIATWILCAAPIMAAAVVLGRTFFKVLVPLAIFAALIVISALILIERPGMYMIVNAILWGSAIITLGIVLGKDSSRVFIPFAISAAFSLIILAHAYSM